MDVSDLSKIYTQVLGGAQERPSTARLLDLSGRVAVVTGGGGPGLGQACAHRLSQNGARVHVNDLDAEAAEQVSAEVARRTGLPTSWSACDVTSPAGAARMVEEAVASHGAVDVLVTTVGGGLREPPLFRDLPADILTATVDRTLMSTIHCVQAVLPAMMERRDGVIVTVSSEASRVTRMPSLYSACKAAVDSLTSNLAVELAEFGIRVNSVLPGYIASPRYHAVLDQPSPPRLAHRLVEGIQRTAMQRPGAPEEVADVIAFLASDAASYVTGAKVRVSGGLE